MSDPINEILEFGEESMNVLAQVDYSADAGRLAGQMPGLARSVLNNTALRQVTRFCRGLAQFIAESYAPGVVDDGDPAKIVDGMTAALVALIAANAPLPGAATETVAGIAQLATEAEALAGTDDATIITPAKLAAALAAALGESTVDEGYIDGGSITPAITDGAALAVVEDGTNDLTRNALSFPGVVKDTHGFFNFRAPGNWDGGTIRAKVLCKGTTGCSAGDDIRFYLACAAVATGENLDVALGTAVTMDGDVVDAGKLIETTASAAMTPSGTPAAGDLLRFRLSRDYDYGAQPMAEPAELVGIVLQFGVTGNIAAWA